MVFYRNVLEAALELAPDETMRAICDVVSTFQMPGNTIEGFTRRSVQIAMAGIYDLRIHRDEVLAPILRSWDVWDRVGLSADGSRRGSSSAATSRSWIGKRAGSRRDAPRVRLARSNAGKASVMPKLPPACTVASNWHKRFPAISRLF